MITMELNEETKALTRSPSVPSSYSSISKSPDATENDATPGPSVPQLRSKSGRLTLDDVMLDMRYSHDNQGFDWSEDIDIVRSGEGERGGDVNATFLNKLREQPLPIRERLKLSRYLRDNLDDSQASPSRTHSFQKAQVSRRYNDIGMGLWRDNITRISAYHGSNVASYFQFLRFLTYLNTLVALLLLAFISLPQILSGDNAIPDNVVGYFGELSTSVMFYGAYSNTTWGDYERPLAYFLTSGSVFVLSFIVILLSMLIRYRRSKYGGSDEEFPYTWRLFTSWDHSVYKKEGALDRVIAIRTEIKEFIRDEKTVRKESCCSRCVLLLGRIAVNVVVLAVLGGSGVLIYVVANLSDDSPIQIPDLLGDFLDRYELPLVVAGLKVLVPLVFDQLIRLESWHPRTELKLTIARTTLFYVASLIVFVASLYDVTTACISTTPNSTISQRNGSEFCCWENEVGEQVFKVLVLDLGITLLVGMCLDVIRAGLVKCCSCTSIGYREVSVASGVLDLTYGQALVWLGIYFSPFLALVGVVKLIIIFYFRYIIARTCCVPPTKVFRASRSGNFYMFILLLNLFFSVFPLAYAIIELQPSNDCGPFRVESHVYDVVAFPIDLPDWLQDGLNYIGTPSVIIPVIILLLLVIFYYMARASSYKNVSRQLRNHLTFERRVEKRRIFAKGRVLNERRCLTNCHHYVATVNEEDWNVTEQPNMTTHEHSSQ